MNQEKKPPQFLEELFGPTQETAEQRRRREQRERKVNAALRKVCSTEEGRIIFQWIKDEAKLTAQSTANSADIYRHAGRQKLGWRLLGRASAIMGEAWYASMFREELEALRHYYLQDKKRQEDTHDGE